MRQLRTKPKKQRACERVEGDKVSEDASNSRKEREVDAQR